MGNVWLKLSADPLALVKIPELLSCLLAAIVLLLSALIVLAALRRWAIMLSEKQEQTVFTEQEPAVCGMKDEG